MLLEVREPGGALAALVVPRGVQAGGALEFQVAAIGIARQAAPAGCGVDVFIGQAQPHGGVGAEVEVQCAVVDLILAGGNVIEILAGLLGHDRPATQGAGFVQRAAGIDLPAVVVPGAGRQRQLCVRGGFAALAHKIHPACRAAGAFHHPGCAAQNFDAVIDRHIAVEAVGLYIAAADVQWHAVVLVLAAHAKAAGVEVFAAHGRVVDGDPRGFFHHLFNGVEVLVVEHFAGDDGDRLRGLLERVRTLADGHRLRSVGTRAFGSGVEAALGHMGGTQLQRSAGLRGRLNAEIALPGDAQLQAAAAQSRVHRLFGGHQANYRRGLLALHQHGLQRDNPAALAGNGIQAVGQRAGGQVEAYILGQGRAGQGCQGNGDAKGVGPRVEHSILLIVWKSQEIGGPRSENRTRMRSIIKKTFRRGLMRAE